MPLGPVQKHRTATGKRCCHPARHCLNSEAHNSAVVVPPTCPLPCPVSIAPAPRSPLGSLAPDPRRRLPCPAPRPSAPQPTEILLLSRRATGTAALRGRPGQAPLRDSSCHKPQPARGGARALGAGPPVLSGRAVPPPGAALRRDGPAAHPLVLRLDAGRAAAQQRGSPLLLDALRHGGRAAPRGGPAAPRSRPAPHRPRRPPQQAQRRHGPHQHRQHRHRRLRTARPGPAPPRGRGTPRRCPSGGRGQPPGSVTALPGPSGLPAAPPPASGPPSPAGSGRSGCGRAMWRGRRPPRPAAGFGLGVVAVRSRRRHLRKLASQSRLQEKAFGRR